MKQFRHLLFCSYLYLAGIGAGPYCRPYSKIIFVFIFCSIMVAGCTQLYHGFQAQSVESCYSLPYSEQQECLERVRSSYEAYEQDRKKKD
jgi:hypothetical protein